MLFYRLGGPALFEPDEGRNAEKAREILLLNDWLTPHENFYPVLDKPMFFYGLIALAYKLVGVNEWAARLPSALAALGCILLVYFFARRLWGEWEARWSALVLVTSLGFFGFARIVIFDMTLTAFMTLALCAFYQASHTSKPQASWGLCLLLYVALAAATLTKGLIGIGLPGMIFFFYLLCTKGWSRLAKIRLLPGILVFLALVIPWYAAAELRHAGYLRYYLWDEHFGRFGTPAFDRAAPWYFYLYIAPLGLLPWSFLLPSAAKYYRQRNLDGRTLWLLLWAFLPMLFFSLSKSKLPQYILPSFPALAILIGVALAGLLADGQQRLRAAIAVSWLAIGAMFIYLLAGLWQGEILPRILRGRLHSLAPFFWTSALVSLALAFVAVKGWPWLADKPRRLYFTQGLGLLLFGITLSEMMVVIAPARSSKEIALLARPFLTPETQMVSYETYSEALAFYLRTERPLWVVNHSNKKRTFLGNFYAIAKRPEPTTRWGKALLDYDEFGERWKAAKTPMVILIKEKNLAAMEQRVGTVTKRLAAAGEHLLVTRP